MAAPSQQPTRFPSGMQTDYKYGPLSEMGMVNPFFYHLFSDDFDTELIEGGYTKTTTGNGTVALTPGDGGRALFTTNSTAPATTDIASIQLPVAGFSLTAGKKTFFLARLQMSDVVNGAFVVGLLNTTTTPFASTDGLYFYNASGSASNLVFVAKIGSVATSIVIPTSAYALANATDVDLAFYVNRKQDIDIFVGSQLVGWLPQSGTGVQTPSGPPYVAGAVAALRQATTPTTLTSAVLNPTLALQSGTASSKTMNADFFMASKER